MRVLVVGGGGREHVICWKLVQDNPDVSLHAAPGNPGIETLAACHSVSATDLAGQLQLARSLEPDLVIIGPEAPLAAGLADVMRASGIAVFGPGAAAARIESSKRYAKELMLQHGIPTARATTHRTASATLAAARALESPVVVIKASGLAAGKGVAVVPVEDAEAAIRDIFRLSGDGESEVLVEEYMDGEELSVFAVCDGLNALLLVPSQDHKRLAEGDSGPNTGGMGAYAPVSIATVEVVERVRREIIEPTLAAMHEDGCPFTGLLYAGLMVTPTEGPKVVEFNCRFGDPESQVVLPLMETSLYELLESAAEPGGLSGAEQPRFRAGSAVTTILATEGYPNTPRTGDQIRINSDHDPDTIFFHAGTRRTSSGNLVTSGGRVIAVTGLGQTLEEALARSQAGAAQVSFPGIQWRRDIGWREQKRAAAAR